MQSWIRRIRAAVVMGIIWAIGWAVIGGAVMEGIVDPHGRIVDMWPQLLGMAGFIGGVFFSTVLGIAGGRRQFEELSFVAFGAWGAVAGVLLGVLAIAMGAGVMIIAPMALLCAGSASSSLALARKSEKRERLDAG